MPPDHRVREILEPWIPNSMIPRSDAPEFRSIFGPENPSARAASRPLGRPLGHRSPSPLLFGRSIPFIPWSRPH